METACRARVYGPLQLGEATKMYLHGTEAEALTNVAKTVVKQGAATTLNNMLSNFKKMISTGTVQQSVPTTPPLPPANTALPGDQRAPTGIPSFIEAVFTPAMVSATRSVSPGEQPLPASAGQPQNRDAAEKQIVPYTSAQGIVGPLGVPTTQPSVNYAQQPPPVVIAPPKPVMPSWLVPVALAGAALFAFTRR